MSKQPKSKVFYKIYMVNVIISCFFILFFALVSTLVSRNFIVDNTTTYNLADINKIASSLDVVIQNMSEDIDRLISHDEISGLILSGDEEYERPLELVNSISLIHDIVNNSSYIDEIYISDYKRDIQLTSLNKSDVQRTAPAVDFLSTDTPHLSYDAIEQRYFYTKYFYSIFDTKHSSITIAIDEDVFEKLIVVEQSWDKDYFLIIDEDILPLGQTSLIANDNLDLLKTESDDEFVSVGDKKLLFHRTPTQTPNISIILAQDYAALLHEANESLVSIIFISLLAILLLSGAMYLITIYHYRPLKELRGHIEDTLGIPANTSDEYRYIEESVLELKQQSDIARQQYQQATPMLAENIVRKLLTYEFDNAKAKLLLEISEKDMSFENFFILISKYGDRELNKKICLETLSSIEADTMSVGICATISTDITVTIYNTYLEYSDIIDMLDDKKHALEELASPIAWYISPFFYSFGDIKEIYSQSMASFERMYFKDNNVLAYSDISGQTHNKSHDNNELERLLIDFIRKKDSDKAESILELFFTDISKEVLDINYARYQYFVLCKQIVSIHLQTVDDYSEINLFKKIFAATTASELNEIAREIVLSCMQDETQQKLEYSDNIQKAINYIKSNYNKDISLSDVANAVYLSAGYLSIIFKNETGKTIYEYITDIRISRSTDLLINSPTMKIKEISAEIGYNNVQSYIRYFKKHYGITPVEYRSSIILDYEEN